MSEIDRIIFTLLGIMCGGAVAIPFIPLLAMQDAPHWVAVFLIIPFIVGGVAGFIFAPILDKWLAGEL